jgi:hypothetical protein
MPSWTPIAALAALALLAPAPALAQAQGPPGVDDDNYEEVPVGGYVPGTLRLTITGSAAFGAFEPGQTRDYTTSLAGTVTSTAGDALLSVTDPSSYETGHLVNSAYALRQPVQVRATSPAGVPSGDYAPVGGTSSPTPLLRYNGPVAADPITIGFKQSIAASEPLRTGPYGKTLTFTLSTTSP